MKNVSDNKALKLQELSINIKRLVGASATDSPKWTFALEEELSTLPKRAISQLDFLISMLLFRKNIGELPE